MQSLPHCRSLRTRAIHGKDCRGLNADQTSIFSRVTYCCVFVTHLNLVARPGDQFYPSCDVNLLLLQGKADVPLVAFGASTTAERSRTYAETTAPHARVTIVLMGAKPREVLESATLEVKTSASLFLMPCLPKVTCHVPIYPPDIGDPSLACGSATKELQFECEAGSWSSFLHSLYLLLATQGRSLSYGQSSQYI
jgi:hypothetical protein